MRENEFYNKIKTGLGKSGHISRLESSTSPGISDVNFAMEGHEWWFELKCERNGKLHFELSQPIWMKFRIAAGIMPYVLWLSQDEQVIHLCEASKIIAAEKTYEKDMAIVQSVDAKQWSWRRKPKMDWYDFMDRLLDLKMPKS